MSAGCPLCGCETFEEVRGGEADRCARCGYEESNNGATRSYDSAWAREANQRNDRWLRGLDR